MSRGRNVTPRSIEPAQKPAGHPTRRLFVILGGLAAVLYLPSLWLPFIGDDYVFLDEVRGASFFRLWSFRNTQFEWYRPWSREVYFWALQSIAGLHPAIYRLSGLLLWLASLGLYASIVRRLTSPRVAIVASMGAVTLALWATPVLWISGSQDLWMVFFGLSTILLVSRGSWGWGLVTFLGALLSKETAAVFAIIVTAFALLFPQKSVRVTIARTLPYWCVLLAWFFIHPTLHRRLLGHWVMAPGGEQPVAASTVVAKTLLSVVNLDIAPRPAEMGGAEWMRLVCAVALAVAGTSWLLRPRLSEASIQPSRRVAAFAGIWALAGWAPLVLPSIGWHAYYGCVGALGAWLAIAVWLDSRRQLVLPVITALAILQWSHANTMSWDWGNEWYQRRAGSFLNGIRTNLQQQYPTLPAHSRVYFGHLPNNIGLVAGQSPAIRVWYADSTLQADFYSKYRPRQPTEPTGQDYFFRFDTLSGMVEVHAGPEDFRSGQFGNSEWEADHEKLAMMFLRAGDYERAAVEFDKVSQLPNRADAGLFAGASYLLAGDSTRAVTIASTAQSRLHLTQDQVRQRIQLLIASVPR